MVVRRNRNPSRHLRLPSSRKEESRAAREEVKRLDAEMRRFEEALEEAYEEEANE